MTTVSSRLAEKAEQLRALHHAVEPLLLPNAWDAASARAVQEAGFPAVATSSVAVAASLGWPDGEQTPVEEMFSAIQRMSQVLDVPLTADIESGYGLEPEALVERLLEAGAVGCNLEDTDHSAGKVLRDASAQAARLALVKQAAKARGVDIVLNARVDVFIRQHAETSAEIDEALRRARLYLEAGADCIYPILVQHEPTIRTLVEGIGAPVNIYAMPQAPPLARLKELGVKRVSFAGRLQRAAIADLRQRLDQIARGEDPS
jgi:2-methylisocitrate lyase-like PEP mutase family enzyme